MESAKLLGEDKPIPCSTLPIIIISKSLVVRQIILAIIKTIKPIKTIGFLPKLSDSGPNINCPKPKPKKIMVINSWLSLGFVIPSAELISGKAGNKASIDNATIDIKEAIKATNSNLNSWGFCIGQK